MWTRAPRPRTLRTVLAVQTTLTYAKPDGGAAGNVPASPGGTLRVPTDRPGTLTFTYEATDTDQATAQANRVVTVRNTVPPTLALQVSDPQYVAVNLEPQAGVVVANGAGAYNWSDLSVVAASSHLDTLQGFGPEDNVVTLLTAVPPADLDQPGDASLVYRATDADGITADLTRTVSVLAHPTLTVSVPQDLVVGGGAYEHALHAHLDGGTTPEVHVKVGGKHRTPPTPQGHGQCGGSGRADRRGG